MSGLRIQDVSVGFADSGEGSPVLLLHSGAASGAHWRGVIEALGGGWRTVTVDFHGFGNSGPWPGKPEARTHEHDMALCLGVLDHVGLGDAAVHLVGHSFGGGVAVRLAVTHPGRIRSLALIEPTVLPLLRDAEPGMADEVRAVADTFMRLAEAGEDEAACRSFIDYHNGTGAWDAMPVEARERLYPRIPDMISGWHANLNHRTTREECGGLRVPALAVYGERTIAPYRRLTEAVAGAIPGCRLAVVPDAGHMAPLTHPRPVAGLLARHLEGVERGSGAGIHGESP